MYSETFNKLEVFIAHLRQLSTFPFGLQEYIHGVTVSNRLFSQYF